MSNPLVSVVMAVYNGEKYLKPTVESTLNQTFKNIEFVIVNDASTDRTKEIIHSYNDPRIKLYNNEKNIGQTKSLNVGLNIAKGKYIARIDAGDVSMLNRLEKQVIFIEKNKEISVLGTSAFRYDESGQIIDIVHMPTSPSIILQRIFYASPLVHISVLMNKQTVLKTGGYNDDFHVLADYELWSRLLQKGYKIWNLREVLSGYMVSADSFGAVNSMGKSMAEATKIIRSNVNYLTKLSISLDQALNIHKMLVFNMHSMSFTEVCKTEKIIVKIFQQMGFSNRNIYHVLLLNYLKYIFTKKNKDKLIFNHTMKSTILKSFFYLHFPRIYDEIILKLCRKFIWKHRMNPYKI